MIVSIHQPNYLPWSGFLQKMTLCDRFVLLDPVPFSKNSYQNRCRIKTAQGPHWLTVPVKTSGHFAQSTRDVEIDQPERMGEKHWRTIELSYRRAPHFEYLARHIEPVLRGTWSHLSALNTGLIARLAEALGITTPLVSASDLGVEGTRSELLCGICRAMGAGEYVSGPSGRGYLDLEVFARHGIRVTYHRFDHPVYPQLYGEFVPGLSAVDLLANCGPSSSGVLAGRGVRSPD